MRSIKTYQLLREKPMNDNKDENKKEVKKEVKESQNGVDFSQVSEKIERKEIYRSLNDYDNLLKGDY
jgi:hypothetical protein